MLERALVALTLILLGYATWRLYNRHLLKRVSAAMPTDPLLADAAAGIPVVVYFTTPFCVPCKTQQQPALAQLQAQYGGALQIIQVDATTNPEAASRWQVLSAPTTFVLDANHRPRHVNHGVATAEQLARQLREVGAA